MELSPRLYRLFVRPPWLTKLYFNTRIKELLKNFDFHNKRVLDFGCGIGSSSFLFSPKHYIGLDCDERRIRYAQSLYKDYQFKTLRDGSLPIMNHSVDYILIMAVLHHIPPHQLSQCLQEFHRILMPQGKIIVIEPCFFPDSPFGNWYMDFFDKGEFIRTEREYLELFEHQGFSTKRLGRFKKFHVYNELFFTASPRM